jgi:hypothetical protein
VLLTAPPVIATVAMAGLAVAKATLEVVPSAAICEGVFCPAARMVGELVALQKPATHPWPAPQAWPQAPQFAGSPEVSVQVVRPAEVHAV